MNAGLKAAIEEGPDLREVFDPNLENTEYPLEAHLSMKRHLELIRKIILAVEDGKQPLGKD